MATSKQTKNHSKDPRRTSGHPFPAAPEDSATHLRLPAKEHLEYQHWYEQETGKKRFTFRKLYSDFLENPSSSLLSILILVIITIFAVLLGIFAIRLIPAPKISFMPGTFQRYAYRKIPPKQVGYEPAGAILLPLEKPTCFALDSENRLYVGSHSEIVVFDLNGKKLSSFSLKDSPTCLEISRPDCLFANHLLVGFPNIVEVYEILADCIIGPKPIFRWKLPGQAPYLKKIFADKDSLLLADAGGKGVYRINAEKEILLKIGFVQGEVSEGFPGFNIPALPFLDIAKSPMEEIFFITNPGKHRIEAFTSSGDWIPQRSWGSISVYCEGFCGCCNPSGLSCFPDGRFLTTEKYLSRVKVYDLAGVFQTVVATPEELEKPPTSFVNVPAEIRLEYRPESDAAQPIQAAVASDGRIAVLDPRYCSVRLYREKSF
ncbi:MAG: hypothetical protein FWC43_01755 [Planctomycetaceae bacterium]|nr:hypothetical protein [Planctomycetaceae bacterium]